MRADTVNRRMLIRSLEACLRRGNSVRDARRALIHTGMTADEVWAIELPIRHLIRSERAGRQAA